MRVSRHTVATPVTQLLFTSGTASDSTVCRYQVQAIPENLIIAYSKRSLPPVKNVNLKSKTPKAAAKPEPAPLIKCTAGTMAPCKHCAQQASDAITARQELAAEQHKTSALSKELESVKRKADVTALVRHPCIYAATALIIYQDRMSLETALIVVFLSAGSQRLARAGSRP